MFQLPDDVFVSLFVGLQEDKDAAPPAGRGLSCKRTIKKKQRASYFYFVIYELQNNKQC